MTFEIEKLNFILFFFNISTSSDTVSTEKTLNYSEVYLKIFDFLGKSLNSAGNS